MSQKTIKEISIGTYVEAYEYRGDDGFPVGKSFSPICVTTLDGDEYYLPLGERRYDEEGFTYYRERYNAERMLIKVQKRCYIETNRWIKMDNRSLEQKLEEYAEEEYYDRLNNGELFGRY